MNARGVGRLALVWLAMSGPLSAALPPAEAFIADARAGRLDAAAFDYEAAGVWRAPPDERWPWLLAVSGALAGPQPGATGECDPRANRPGEVHTWFIIAMAATDAEEWRRANRALRARIAALDAQIESKAMEAGTGPREPRLQELQRRFARDQWIRRLFDQPAQDLPRAAAAVWPGVKYGLQLAIDCDNTRWLKEQLAEIGWFDIPRFGAESDEAAWHLVQHADRDPDFQRTLLARLQSLPREHTSQQRIAYLWDRVARQEGRPQRYGTQGNCQPDGTWQSAPSEDPAQLDARRTALGMLPLARHAALMSTQSCTKPAAK